MLVNQARHVYKCTPQMQHTCKVTCAHTMCMYVDLCVHVYINIHPEKGTLDLRNVFSTRIC